MSQHIEGDPENGRNFSDAFYKSIFLYYYYYFFFCILILHFWQLACICSDNDLALKRPQAIIWHNDVLIYWRIHSSLNLGWVNLYPVTWRNSHYNDIIKGAIASQMTSLKIVYSTVYSDADQRNYQSSASLAFVRGIHRRPVNSPHKWPVTPKVFPFDDVIMDELNYIQLYEEILGVFSDCTLNITAWERSIPVLYVKKLFPGSFRCFLQKGRHDSSYESNVDAEYVKFVLRNMMEMEVQIHMYIVSKTRQTIDT